jgi:hypothetical protein
MQRGDYTPTFRQFWTGNASVRRSRLLEAGLFDVSLKRGEDVDLGFRLAQLGVQYQFSPEARGLHYAERSLESFCRAHASYGEMEVTLFARDASGADEILRGNWNRMKSVQTAVLARATANEASFRALAVGLQAALSSGFIGIVPLSARNAACSLLANLMFWRSCRLTVGENRFRLIAGLGR